jgi:hypothetical protein
MRSVVAG